MHNYHIANYMFCFVLSPTKNLVILTMYSFQPLQMDTYTLLALYCVKLAIASVTVQLHKQHENCTASFSHNKYSLTL